MLSALYRPRVIYVVLLIMLYLGLWLPRKHKEASDIVLIVLDVGVQSVEAVQLSCTRTCNRRGVPAGPKWSDGIFISGYKNQMLHHPNAWLTLYEYCCQQFSSV